MLPCPVVFSKMPKNIENKIKEKSRFINKITLTAANDSDPKSIHYLNFFEHVTQTHDLREIQRYNKNISHNHQSRCSDKISLSRSDSEMTRKSNSIKNITYPMIFQNHPLIEFS